MTPRLSRWILRLFGWKVVGEVPDISKFVVIGAPHTSNWDFPIGLLAARVLGIRISWIGKAGLFRHPWGPLMQWLGGIPTQRTGSEGLVALMAERFAEADRLVLVIAPEGTRKAAPFWRSGFYRIALGAGVPIVPAAVDAGRKEIRIGGSVSVTGDVRADMDRMRQFFEGSRGIKPKGQGPVRLEAE